DEVDAVGESQVHGSEPNPGPARRVEGRKMLDCRPFSEGGRTRLDLCRVLSAPGAELPRQFARRTLGTSGELGKRSTVYVLRSRPLSRRVRAASPRPSAR